MQYFHLNEILGQYFGKETYFFGLLIFLSLKVYVNFSILSFLKKNVSAINPDILSSKIYLYKLVN